MLRAESLNVTNCSSDLCDAAQKCSLSVCVTFFADCCSNYQLLCVVLCCIVLQCVAVRCSVFAAIISTSVFVLQCVVVCCSVLQCVAMSCSKLQCVATTISTMHF